MAAVAVTRSSSVDERTAGMPRYRRFVFICGRVMHRVSDGEAGLLQTSRPTENRDGEPRSRRRIAVWP